MSIIGHICEMAEETGPRLGVGRRARFTGDDMRDEGDACREIVGTIETVTATHASLRDDDGNPWAVELAWLEPVETDGRAE